MDFRSMEQWDLRLGYTCFREGMCFGLEYPSLVCWESDQFQKLVAKGLG